MLKEILKATKITEETTDKAQGSLVLNLALSGVALAGLVVIKAVQAAVENSDTPVTPAE